MEREVAKREQSGVRPSFAAQNPLKSVISDATMYDIVKLVKSGMSPMSVMVSVAVSKMGVILHQTWSENQ